MTIIGSTSLAGAYPAAVDLMHDVAETVRALVTDVVRLEDYADAVARAKSPTSIKVHVRSGAAG